MLKKATYNHGLATDGWVSVDPAYEGIIEGVYKKNIREGEEKLVLAVLQDAVNCFQTNALAGRPWGKRLFQEAEEWILEKMNTENKEIHIHPLGILFMLR